MVARGVSSNVNPECCHFPGSNAPQGQICRRMAEVLIRVASERVRLSGCTADHVSTDASALCPDTNDRNEKISARGRACRKLKGAHKEL